MGISFRFQIALKKTNTGVAAGFYLLLQALICLAVIAVPAAADEAGSEVPVSYSLNKYITVQKDYPVRQSHMPLPRTWLAQTEFPVLDEDYHDGDEKPEEKKETIEPVTRKLPFWGEKVREMGFDLPLPFGAGLNLVLMEQGIDIRNLKIGIGEPTIEISGIDFGDVRSHDRATTARLDMWLLPFANIYGILGYINGETELDLDIGSITSILPGPGLPPNIDLGTTDFNIDYNGTTFGGGMTLAGGYKDFFFSLDANYTYSKVDVVDGTIRTVTVSPRLGMLFEDPAIKGSLAFWVGAMYMKYKQTITDDISLQEIDPRLPPVQIDFKLDLKNDKPWNFLFGGQWEISKRWQIMAEGGVGNRKQLVLGAFFRF